MKTEDVGVINALCEAAVSDCEGVDCFRYRPGLEDCATCATANTCKAVETYRAAGSPRIELPSAEAPWQVAFCRAYILVNAMAGETSVTPAMSQTCGLIAESMTKYMPGEGGPDFPMPSAEALEHVEHLLNLHIRTLYHGEPSEHAAREMEWDKEVAAFLRSFLPEREGDDEG